MKIVFDNIIFALQRCGGISVVWGNLLRLVAPKGDSITMIEYKGSELNMTRKDLDITCAQRIIHPSICMSIQRLRDISASEIKENKKFVFHSSYYRLCHHPKALNVTTVHDFGYYLFVKNPLLRYIHCRQQFRAIRKADAVVCISESTRRDLQRILPDVPVEKTHVVYNGVSEQFHPIPEIKKETFALFVGKRDRYKNFDALIAPLGETNKPLLIVGPSLSKEEIAKLEAHHVYYKYFGIATDTELNTLYNQAYCLLYTSLYEGFGLPVLEAQRAGCPVIAMNTSSIPEVIGDRRMLLDELTTENLKNIFTMLDNPTTREDIVRCGLENANRFSWERMAEGYYQLYTKLLQ